jgi:hypothetical protein
MANPSAAVTNLQGPLQPPAPMPAGVGNGVRLQNRPNGGTGPGYVNPYAGYGQSSGGAGVGGMFGLGGAGSSGGGATGGTGGGTAGGNPNGKGPLDPLTGLPVVGGLLGSLDNAFVAPNTYNANGNLTLSTNAAGQVYNTAMDIAGALGPAPTATITADNIGTPGAIAGGAGQGVGSAGLQAATLGQAQAAANSPSSAAAQMRAAEGQIEGQQAGMAAMARGGDRAGARRAAMLGTGTQEQGAAATTAALAAQENEVKQAAYTNALLGQQGATTAVGGLQANVAEANQGANLTAQNSTIANQQAGYNATNAAQNATLGTALQGVGATNQAQGVASAYGTGQNALQGKTASGLVGLAMGGAQALGLSDERAKTDIAPIGDSGLDALMASTHGETTYGDMAQAFGTPDLSLGTTPTWADRLAAAGESYQKAYDEFDNPHAARPVTPGKQDFLKWQMPATAAPAADSGGSSALAGLGKLIGTSDERCKAAMKQIGSAGTMERELATAYGLPTEDGATPYPTTFKTSDERAKQQVEQMGDKDLIDQADKWPLITFRYKPGVEDDGIYPHVGATAQALEQSGPLGRMMVETDPTTGLKKVDYGALAYATAKAALAKADENLNTKAAYPPQQFHPRKAVR